MRPVLSSLRAALGPSLLIGMVAASGAWLVIGADLAAGVREDLSDQLLPDAPADPRVLVVAIEDDFMARARDPFVWQELIDVLGNAGAVAYIVPADLVALANPGFDKAQWESLAATVFENYQGLTFAAGDVVLGRPQPGSSFPTLVNDEISNVLAGAADAVGFETAVLDLDEQEFRTAPLVAERPGERGRAPTLVPSAAVVAMLEITGVDARIEETSGGLDIGGRRVPTESDQRLRVTWAPELLPGGSQVVSAVDLLDGVGLERFGLATVVVGTTGSAHADFVPSPVGEAGRLASPFVEAQVINTLLTEDYLEPTGDLSVVVGAGVLGSVIALLVLVLPLWLVPAVPAAGAAVVWLGSSRAIERGSLVDPGVGFAVVALAVAAALLWRVLTEFRRRHEVTRLFTQYVPEKVARQLVDKSTLAEVTAGRRLEASVLFCDLRGFTPLSAQLEAHQIRELLDVFYDHLTHVILDHDGTVIQFTGDEVYAVFGAPFPRSDHAERAVACAHAILVAGPAIDADLDAIGLPPIGYGIGVNSGEVVAAHAGTDTRRQYTVLGDPVNVAARLCSNAGRGEALIAAATLGVADERGSSVELLELKGVAGRFPAVRINVDGPIVAPSPASVTVGTAEPSARELRSGSVVER